MFGNFTLKIRHLKQLEMLHLRFKSQQDGRPPSGMLVPGGEMSRERTHTDTEGIVGFSQVVPVCGMNPQPVARRCKSTVLALSSCHIPRGL